MLGRAARRRAGADAGRKAYDLWLDLRTEEERLRRPML
jgi:hypothetical protein